MSDDFFRVHEAARSKSAGLPFAEISRRLAEAVATQGCPLESICAQHERYYVDGQAIANPDGLHITATGAEGKYRTLYVTIGAGLINSNFRPTVVQGNHSVTGCKCGAFAESDIMRHAGYRIDDPEYNRRMLKEFNFAYLHAPLYHPILDFYGKERGELGFADVFKLTTALLDPARSASTYFGVYDPGLRDSLEKAAKVLPWVKNVRVVGGSSIDEYSGDLTVDEKMMSVSTVGEEWTRIVSAIRKSPLSNALAPHEKLVWLNAAGASLTAEGVTEFTPASVACRLEAFADEHSKIVAHIERIIQRMKEV